MRHFVNFGFREGYKIGLLRGVENAEEEEKYTSLRRQRGRVLGYTTKMVGLLAGGLYAADKAIPQDLLDNTNKWSSEYQ